jgi:hypothetical protein
MENAVRSGVHTSKDTWHSARQMSRLSVHTELESVFKSASVLSNQVQIPSLLSVNKYVVFVWFFKSKFCGVIV